ncbi:MAG: DNA-methyltransferase [Elusimicrobiota bacterium]
MSSNQDFLLMVGDAKDMLKEIPDLSVHCVITSPPYFRLRDYGIKGQIGNEDSINDYIQKLIEIFRRVKRVLRDDSTLWINMGDSYNGSGGQGTNPYIWDKSVSDKKDGKPINDPSLKKKDLIGIPWRLALALQEDGWWLRSDIIWHKTNPVPESVKDRPSRSHEHIFLFSKSHQYFFDKEACSEYKGDVWKMSTASRSRKNHKAVYPRELVRRCLLGAASIKGCCSKCLAPVIRKIIPPNISPSSSITKKGVVLNKKDSGIVKYIEETGIGGYRIAIDGDKHYSMVLEQPVKGGKTSQIKNKGYIFTYWGLYKKYEWEKTCDCNDDIVPCTILDPFSGSGTTGSVALEYGYNYIGIDINKDDIDFSRKQFCRMDPIFIIERKKL